MSTKFPEPDPGYDVSGRSFDEVGVERPLLVGHHHVVLAVAVVGIVDVEFLGREPVFVLIVNGT